MSDLVTITALRNFPYADRKVVTGDQFELPAGDAALLIHAGHARKVEPVAAAPPPAVRQPPPLPRPTALEPTTEPGDSAAAPAPAPSGRGSRGGRTRTRELKAEDATPSADDDRDRGAAARDPGEVNNPPDGRYRRSDLRPEE